MTVALGDVAEIQLGYAFRSGIESDPDGAYRLVQLKDLGSSFLELQGLVRIPDQSWGTNYHLNSQDLIFRSRAGNFGFVQIPETEELLILAAPLFRVRVKQELLRPEYLLWFAALESSQEYFSSRAEGTAQKMINRKALEEFPVEIPQLSHQDTIIQINRLQSQENELTSQIQLKRNLVTKKILNQSLKLKGASHVQ